MYKIHGCIADLENPYRNTYFMIVIGTVSCIIIIITQKRIELNG